jgi:pimeloyl-ACP methyl ester carboxylesterase
MRTINRQVFAVVALLAMLVASVFARPANPEDKAGKTEAGGTTMKKAGYAPVNGLQMYYEIHGNGDPVILLHGGVGASDMFGPILPKLAESQQVIAVELQGHGRTADIDRPLRYELLADDVAALLKHLGIKQADVVGYSLGGGVALRIAVQHPDRVRKLVLISAPCKRDGWFPEVQTAMTTLGRPEAVEGIKQSPWFKLYPKVDWAKLFTKLVDLLKRDYDWSREVTALKTPTMLVFADADAVRPAHIVEFYGLLGGGKKDAGWDGSARSAAQLAILPGYTHYNLLSSAAFPTLVLPFLDGPLPQQPKPKGQK